MHDCYSCIFTYSSFKLIRKCYKIVKITVFCTLDHSVEMASACEIKHQLDVNETLCPQQMLVHKGGQIKNLSGESRDVIPTKLQCQTIQRALQSPNLQREIIRKK